MDVVDHIGLGKFKTDLHEKLETVHEPVADVNNISEKINNIIEVKSKPYKYEEDIIMKQFMNLPEMDGIKHENFELEKSGVYGMSNETMMRKNWKYNDRVERGTADNDDIYNEYKISNNSEDAYLNERNKVIGAMNMNVPPEPAPAPGPEPGPVPNQNLGKKTNKQVFCF